MFRLLLLAALTGPTINLPIHDAKIFFPGENIPIEPRGGYFPHTGQTGQRTYYTKSSHRKGGGFPSPILLSSAASASGHSYSNPGHHLSYSSYGHHHPNPHHLSYSSYSYGSAGSHHQPHPHTFQSQSHSYASSQSHGSGSGSVEGQIEQVSHGNYGSGSLDDSKHEISQSQSHSYGGSQSHGAGSGSVDGQIEQVSHGNYGSGSLDDSKHEISQSQSHSYGGSQSHGAGSGSVEGQIEQVSHGNYGAGSLDSKHEVNSWQETGIDSHDDHPTHGKVEQIEESARPVAESSHEQAKNPSVAAEEHHIIQELEQLVGLTSPPGGITKNPITQQQEIIREINGLKDPHQKEHTEVEDSGLSYVIHETTIPPVRHYERIPEEPQEVEEAPMVKETSDQGHQGVGHQVIHTELHHQGSFKTKATPDPLDLMSIYNDYVQGDFKAGHVKETAHQPKKELKPEIKQAIDNIMKEWEVIPENEGKLQPPPRNYKITKHVKVTTTHNHPVLVQPSQTITKTVLVQPSQTITKTIQTHTFHPSTSHHRHHINIAELLEQLQQLESSPHHRNITWCEEKIKEFLTELNRKEESGIEINQSVQEQTLHHILTQDQTITKEVHHETEHEVNSAVEEEPFVKKTVVELGLNEPTKPPSYWTEQEVKQDTNSIPSGHVQESGSVEMEEQIKNEPQETSEEYQIVTVTPSPHQPLEALSHQSHASENENPSGSENEVDMESHGSDFEGVTRAPVTPERPGKPETDEFRGESERKDRPLPEGYKPRERSEEENDIENESGRVEGPKEDHKRIDELSIELPQIEPNHEETKDEEEQKSGESLNVEGEDTKESNQQEHVIHELNNGDHLAGKTEYVVESEHQQTGDSNGHSEKDTITDTVEHHPEGHEGHSGGGLTEQIGETVEHTGGDHGHSGKDTITETEHHPEGHEGHSGGSFTEQVEENVEHNGGGHGHSGGGINTDYVEETIHHSSEASHSGGGNHNVYVEETVEHQNTAGNNQINYDQLIEELISLESLPGHQAIDKCEEKIRHFLEVLKRQQERGFDQNQAELRRLRLLLEEIEKQKHNQSDNGVNPHSSEGSNSFWKKIGRKIKTTIEKAKTKAHDTVNGMMN